MADDVELLLPVNRDLPFAGDPRTSSRLVSSAGGYLSNAVGCSPTTAVSPRSHSPLEDCPGSVLSLLRRSLQFLSLFQKSVPETDTALFRRSASSVPTSVAISSVLCPAMAIGDVIEVC